MYSEQDYKNIFYLVKNDKLVGYSKYQKLVPYNHILKVMFEPWTCPRGIDDYTKDCLDILKKIPDPLKNIDENMIKLCTYKDPISMCDYLECIFLPKKVLKDTFGNVNYFMRVFGSLVYNYAAYNDPIVFTYSKFNTFYQYFDKLFYNDDFDRYYNIIITLLCYIYVNDGDYGIIEQFLSDPKFFADILKMNGIDFRSLSDECISARERMNQKLYEKGSFLYNKNLIDIK